MADSSDLALAAIGSNVGRARILIACYALAIAVALALEGLFSTTAGAVACALLVALLLNHHVASVGVESDADGAFLALTLVPLAGLLSVVMPVAQVSLAGWPLLAATPLLLAVALSARQLGLRREALCLVLKFPSRQIGIALLGLPLGLLAYGGLRPAGLGGGAIALGVISLSLLAFAEELLFRGLVQPLMLRLYGGLGIALTAAFSAAAALGAHSLPYGVFAGLVAGGFGVASQRTGSIAGTSASRALLSIGLLIVWPEVMG